MDPKEIEDIHKRCEAENVALVLGASLAMQKLYYNYLVKIFTRLWPLLPKNTENPFNFDVNPVQRRILYKAVDGMINEIDITVRYRVNKAWELSKIKNDYFIRAMLGGREISDKVKEKLFAPNTAALKSFLNRTQNGLTLSERIWNTKPQILSEIEAGLQLGIGEGKSATAAATSMKQFLNDPDRLFRRVRDKYGNLQLSKAAAKYHPGKGKYRSSYQNAVRLTANETNMSYRAADFERWQSMPMVLGVEVKLSNRHQIEDVCDQARGIYPRGFKFTGWHVRCLCHAVPVLPSEKTFEKYIDSIMQGEDYEFSGQVETIPESMKTWYADNKDRIKNWKTAPNFIKDNAAYLSAKKP